MNRPQMINPVTKNIMNIFSEEFENLLDQGYTIEQLLNIKTSDLPILPTSTNIPLTGYPDIDLNILRNVDYNYLKKYCQLNKYTYKLCQRKDFWLDIIKRDGLTLPKPLNIKDVDWMLVYFSLRDANTMFLQLNDDWDDVYTIYIYSKYNISTIISLLNKSNINIPDVLLLYDKDVSIEKLKLQVVDEDRCIIDILFYHLQPTEISVNEKEINDFLFYLNYYNILRFFGL